VFILALYHVICV